MPDQFDLLARQAVHSRVVREAARVRDVEAGLERTAVREMVVDPQWEVILQRITAMREAHAHEMEGMTERLNRTFLSPDAYGAAMTALAYARGVVSALDAIVGYVVACTREET